MEKQDGIVPEQTNQTQDADDMFDPAMMEDGDIETNDDSDENAFGEPNADNPQDAVEPDKKSEGKKVKVKYNGEEKELDVEADYDNIVELVQKGMNYDHVNQEKESLKNSEEFAFLEEMAKEAGVKDRKEFMAKLREDIQNTKISTRAEELMDEGMSRDHALYTAKLEIEKQSLKPQTKETAPDQSTEWIENAKKGFEVLLRERKDLADIPFEKYPEEVRDMIVNKNIDPLAAWNIHEKKQLEAQFAQLKHQNDVKNRDLGNLKTAKDDEKVDDFLSGFMKF